MLNADAIILEYEYILLGKKDNFSMFFFTGDPCQKEAMSLVVLKYAFNDLLGWDFETLRDNVTADLLRRLKVDTLVKFVSFPPELDRRKDLFYLAYKLHPERKYPRRELLLRAYTNVMEGKAMKFPKDFFLGGDGILAACVALQYVLDKEKPLATNEELYRFFTEPGLTTFLRKHRLMTACQTLFDDPLEYLDCTLSPQQKDPLLLNYYRFNMAYGK